MTRITPLLPNDRPLTCQEEAFCDYLLADERMSAPLAYARAFGQRGPEARQAAAALLKKSLVRDRIRSAQAARRVVCKLEAQAILKDLAAVVGADPRELIEYRRGACRYCWGDGHGYQRTPAEYDRDSKEYLSQQRLLDRAKVANADVLGLLFDVQGGIGFNPNRRPAVKCPECHGHGVGYTYVKDSRTLSHQAARLYAGVKETKDGLEIKLRSVDKAVELAMRHLGLLDVNGKPKSAEETAAMVRELLQQVDGVTGGPEA